MTSETKKAKEQTLLSNFMVIWHLNVLVNQSTGLEMKKKKKCACTEIGMDGNQDT